MKRIILTITMSFMLFFTAMAEGNNTHNAEAYEMNVNTEALARSLNVNKDQTESIENIMQIFVAQMNNTKVEDNDSTRTRMLENSVNMNINYMKQVLTDEQYRKYLSILNSTLSNRGLR